MGSADKDRGVSHEEKLGVKLGVRERRLERKEVRIQIKKRGITDFGKKQLKFT